MEREVDMAERPTHNRMLDLTPMRSQKPPPLLPPEDTEEKPVLSLVRMDSRLFEEANLESASIPICRNAEIMVLELLTHGWVRIRNVETGKTGCMNRDHILQRPDGTEKGTKLYRIKEHISNEVYPEVSHFYRALFQFDDAAIDRGIAKSYNATKSPNGKWYKVEQQGDTLEKIITRNYPERGGMDLRTIANVILEINNPDNDRSKGIYVSQPENEIQKWHHSLGYNYKDIIIKGGYDILIPTWETVVAMSDSTSSGSLGVEMIKALWKDNFGFHFEVEGKCVFASVGVGGNLICYFFRSGNTINLHFSVMGAGGISIGAGAGVALKGSNGKNRGIGLTAGYDAEAMIGGEATLDFEIPITTQGLTDFVSTNYKMLVRLGDKNAAKAFVEDYEHFAGEFLVKAVTQANIRGRIEAEAKLGIKRSGTNAESVDVNGNEAATMEADNSTRRPAEEHIRGESLMEKLKGIMSGKVFRTPTEMSISDVLSVIGEFLSLGVGGAAEAGISLGSEYERTEEDKDRIWIFIEGHALARLNLPIPIPLQASIGAGIRVGYTRYQEDNVYVWRPSPPEAYGFSGTFDNFQGPAWEMFMPVKERKGAANLSPKERVIQALRSIRFNKRFFVDVGSPKLQRRLKVLTGVSALASSDGQAKGITGILAGTIELDLKEINPEDEILKPIIDEWVKQAKAGQLKNPLDWISTALQTSTDPETGKTTGVGNLLVGVIQPKTVTSCVVHAHLGMGGAFSGKAGANLKFQFDVSGSGGLVWEKDMVESVTYILEGKDSKHNPSDYRNTVATAINEVSDGCIDLILHLIDKIET